MPLKVHLNVARSPYYRIRGTVCGERIDQSSGLTGKREAEKVADRITGEIRRRHIDGATPQKVEELSFAEAVENYLAEPGRTTAFNKDLVPLIRHFGLHKLSEIDQAAIDAYVRVRHAGQQPASVRRHTITPISAVLVHAGISPKLRRPKEGPGRLRYLTHHEAARLIECAAPHLKPLIIFCLNTGARMGEALALEWAALDLAGRRVVFLDTKNGESRGVPLNDAAFEALANMDYPTGIRGSDNKPIRTRDRVGRVFRTHLGGNYPLFDGAGGQIKTGWRMACARAGIKDATPHTMRHTFASWLVMAGAPLKTVAELMGHKGLDMVARYTHLSPDHLAGAVSLIGQNAGSNLAEARKAQ